MMTPTAMMKILMKKSIDIDVRSLVDKKKVQNDITNDITDPKFHRRKTAIKGKK